MTITLTPEIEAAVAEQARQKGITPESLALDSLREKFIEQQSRRSTILIEPRDEWERRLANIGVPTGISLTDEQVSSEGIYQDHD